MRRPVVDADVGPTPLPSMEEAVAGTTPSATMALKELSV